MQLGRALAFVKQGLAQATRQASATAGTPTAPSDPPPGPPLALAPLLKNGDAVVVRPLGPQDAARFNAFVGRLDPYRLQGLGDICDNVTEGQEVGDPAALVRERYQLRDGNYGAFLADGRLVGVGGFTAPPANPEFSLVFRRWHQPDQRDPRHSRYATSTTTVVDPDLEGQGIATYLIERKLWEAFQAGRHYRSFAGVGGLKPITEAAGRQGWESISTMIGSGAPGRKFTVVDTQRERVPSDGQPARIERSSDVRPPDVVRQDALVEAVRAGDLAGVEALRDGGADIAARTADGDTLIQVAAQSGNTALIAPLVAWGARPDDQPDVDGRTALHIAASAADATAVTALLQSGAAVDATDRWGRTPLHEAAANGSEAIEALVQHRADVNAADHSGATPLHRAALHASPATVGRLIQLGADVHAETQLGETPLHFAARAENPAAQVLAEHGAEVDARDVQGQTPLHVAARDGNRQAIAQLVAAGADLEARNHQEDTPLHAAGRTRDRAKELRNTAALLEYGADIDAADARGNTALMDAVKNFRERKVALLLERGADPHLPDRTGTSPRAWVTDYRNYRLRDRESAVIASQLQHAMDLRPAAPQPLDATRQRRGPAP